MKQLNYAHIEIKHIFFTNYVYVGVYYKFRRDLYDMWFETRRRGMRGYVCMCARLGGGAPQWIFQFHVVFSFAHRRFHPSASSFALACSKPRSASLTLEVCAACLCVRLWFTRSPSGTARASLSHYTEEGEVNQGGGVGEICRFQTLRAWWIRRYTATASDVYREPSWKLLVMQLAAGAGNPGQTDSSHRTDIAGSREAGTILKLVARLPPYRFPI